MSPWRVILGVVFVIIFVVKGVWGANKSIDDAFQELFQRAATELYPKLSEFSTDEHISTRCISAILRMYTALRLKEFWVIRLLLSSGTLPQRIPRLGLSELGDFDTCINVNEPTGRFSGQYCTVYLTPPRTYVQQLDKDLHDNNVYKSIYSIGSIPYNTKSIIRYAFRLGVCVPSLCSAQEVHYMLHSQTSNNFRWGTYIRFFSLRRNLKHLLSPVGTSSEDVAFVGGIKFIMITWIILGHAYFAVDPTTMSGLADAQEMLNDVWYGVISSAFFGVTTFFFFSGYFLTITWEKFHKTLGNIPKIVIYLVVMFRRYLRLTIPTAFVLLYSSVIPLVLRGEGSGGFFEMITSGCKKNWWHVLFYFNNFNTLDKMCNYHFWFLAADTQIFAVALILVMFLSRYPVIVSLLLIFLSIASSIGVGVQTIVGKYNFFMAPGGDYNEFVRLTESIYTKPHTHASAVFIGVFVGYLVTRTNFKMSKMACIIAWGTSAVVAIIVMFLPLHWHMSEVNSPLIKFIYSAFNRPAWALITGWVVYAFVRKTHFVGCFRRFLSHQIFVVLGRLTFAMYLVHWPVLTYKMGYRRLPVQYEHFFLYCEALSASMISFIIALILYLTIEAPFTQFDLHMFPRKNLAEKKEGQNGTNGFTNSSLTITCKM